MLNAFFNPQGVAVIGASGNPQKMGYAVIQNMLQAGYAGKIYPINPAPGKILGFTAYPSVLEAPDPLDLAIVIVPAQYVIGAVEQCGKRGVNCVVVASGGFGETDVAGQAREAELLAVAKKYGVRVIGPNCIGTMDTHTPINGTFIAGLQPRTGNIGLVSQSGALCVAIIDWAIGAGLGFSRVASLGNQMDVAETEVLAELAADPGTRVITVYMEGVKDGPAFLKTAAQISRKLPLIVLKGGKGESGAKAVASHTGALAGSAEAYETAFRQAGVLSAPTTEALLDWARALSWQPLPKGRRAAVLTNAGGSGILAVDALEAAGLQLAPLTEATRDYLKRRLPPAGSVRNPVDILAGSGPGLYGLALDALLADPTVDAVLVLMAPNDWFLGTSLAEVLADVASLHRKPVLASIMGRKIDAPVQEIFNRREIPNYPFPERAAGALAAMVRRMEWLAQPAQSPVWPEGVDYEAARAALARADFPALLAAYGIPLPPTRLAATKDEAVAHAGEMGYPVVLKLASAEITHKTDVGGVALNLADAEAVRSAFGQIIERARQAHPHAVIDGVTVQKMLIGGQEVLIGLRRDAQFGAMVVAGSGGVEVELVRDVATGLVPLTPAQAEALIDATRAGVRLKGWRGSPPADRDAVLAAIHRLGRIGLDFPQIAELEINPFYVLAQGAFAVDVRGALD